LVLYLGVNAATAGRSTAQPLFPFERRLPLVVAAYPLYASVYLEVLLPLFLCPTRRAFVRTQVAVAVVSLLAFAVFLAAPMPYPRPALSARSGCGALLAIEWAIDGPRCTFPSLHVAIALVLALGISAEAPRWRWPLLALALGVGVSTVLVKQHFAVDVVGGALLGVGGWWASPALLRLWLGEPQTLTSRGA
jgi:membrane-associated phospholipid phosphatase